MSQDMGVYTRKNQISDELIPKIVARLNEFEMQCEIDPSYSLVQTDGYAIFKFTLNNPPLEKLRGKVLSSGCEVYIEPFDLKKEIAERNKDRSFKDKLFGKKQPFESPEIDKLLAKCDTLLRFVWHGWGDSFSVRFAMLLSAILSEMTNGVCTYLDDNLWYPNEGIVNSFWKEVQEFEADFKDDWHYMLFNGWDAEPTQL